MVIEIDAAAMVVPQNHALRTAIKQGARRRVGLLQHFPRGKRRVGAALGKALTRRADHARRSVHIDANIICFHGNSSFASFPLYIIYAANAKENLAANKKIFRAIDNATAIPYDRDATADFSNGKKEWRRNLHG